MSTIDRSTPEQAQASRLAWARHPADGLTPVAAFLALRAAGLRPALLESVETAAQLARYTFVCVDPVAEYRGRAERATLRTETGEEVLEGSSLETFRETLRRHAVPRPAEGLPPFCGGWVGAFTYEWSASLEPTVPRGEQDPWGLPEAMFDLYRTVLAFDHAAQVLFTITSAGDGAASYEAAQARLDELFEQASTPSPESGAFHADLERVEASETRESFEAKVEELREAIGQGEQFQAVLSQRFRTPLEGDPFTLYRALRVSNPSPHMFFWEAEGLAWIGSSPERLVRAQGERLLSVPIAGTRPRGETAREDARLASELLADTKERAEHDMLVDLARNDLGRVARVGTVELRSHAVIERFSRVQHMVSRVEAELATGHDALDALAASFPAGTVSGAPKIRAMQHLARLEGVTRGPYAGCFGYVDGSGNLDMAICIRTLIARGDELSFQVGAGVVHDSVPAHEYDETHAKAAALLDAVRLANSPAFQPRAETSRPALQLQR